MNIFKSAIFMLLIFGMDSLLAEEAGSSLLAEAKHELDARRTSRYQHKTDVDEERGRFDYDCSGFVDYALKKAAPSAYGELPISKPKDKRPLAKDFFYFFESLKVSATWTTIRSARDLRAGDIIAWLRPQDVNSKNTGHVMIVLEKPVVSNKEIFVRVVDSSRSAHADDTRAQGETGLGTGIIGLLIDDSGTTTGYHWRGGVSKKSEVTPILFGRLK